MPNPPQLNNEIGGLYASGVSSGSGSNNIVFMPSVKTYQIFIICLVCLYLSGCYTPGLREQPGDVRIGSYTKDIGTNYPNWQPVLRIKTLQRIGSGLIYYPSNHKMISLFVPPGDYKAILECLIPETGADAQRIVSSGTPLEPDGKYSFSLKYVHKDFGYSFDCAISDKGVVFIELSGHDEIEVTG